jgi:hypothetical protein
LEAADLIWIVRHSSFTLADPDGIIVGAVNEKNRRKPGYVEHLSDWILNEHNKILPFAV